MKIWTHLYHLHSSRNPTLDRLGVLLKVEWAPEAFGYGDLHPYPEFGEPSLSEELAALASVRPSALADLALEFSYLDFKFRRTQRSAFLGLPLPTCHALVWFEDPRSPRDIEALGFTHVKVKMGRDLPAETHYLEQLMAETRLKVRLDFNARLAPAEFGAWWSERPSAFKARLDFVEDPVRTSEDLAVEGPWADDWSKTPGARIQIVKPMRQTVQRKRAYKRFVFTHSLEHPLGQATSLWAAARFYRRYPGWVEVCGLGDAHSYQASDFSKIWSCAGPRLKPPPGLGFGFDEVLRALPWERIV